MYWQHCRIKWSLKAQISSVGNNAYWPCLNRLINHFLKCLFGEEANIIFLHWVSSVDVLSAISHSYSTAPVEDVVSERGNKWVLSIVRALCKLEHTAILGQWQCYIRTELRSPPTGALVPLTCQRQKEHEHEHEQADQLNMQSAVFNGTSTSEYCKCFHLT